MKFKIGRNNLAATIYVPYDCANNCPFCTSKQEYKAHKPNEDKVLDALKNLVKNPYIKEIVFTGGEPTANIDLLEEMLYIARNKRVFVNTTLPSKNFFKFLELVREGDINGVNVSRHATSFEEDSKLFHSIVDDWALEGISVPVKINAVLTAENTLDDVKKIIKRWKGKENITLCFRHDFRTTTWENLHSMSGDKVLDYLADNYTFDSHTFCDVCDTIRFEEGIAYHRGMEHSSFKVGNTVVVNDIIVFPDGFVAYDWDRKPISELDGFYPESTEVRAPARKNSRGVNTAKKGGETHHEEEVMSSCGVGHGSCGRITCSPNGCGFSAFGGCGLGLGGCR